MNIAIIGLGLMGGSLGSSLKRGNHAGRVRGYARRAETRDGAIAQGIIDEAFDSMSACVEGADLVVLCLPVLAMESCLEECRHDLKADALVTDVGSTKGELHLALTAALEHVDSSYIGSHPLTGSDESGLEAIDAELYRESLVIITPDEQADENQVTRLWEFWMSIGAIVQAVSPAEHDRIVAATSHFPHLLASVLVRHVLGRDGGMHAYCGAGFKDATRIAGGPSDVWHDIFRSNRENVLAELDACERHLAGIREILQDEDYESLRGFLDETRDLRRKVN